MSEIINKLYSQPFPSTRNGALFNAFSYPTKISPEAIAVFIACHTKVGDTIMDPFGGSGTTGIACKLCDSPTEGMIEYARKNNLSPKWGPRKGIIYELSPIGTLAGSVMCSGESAAFEHYARLLLAKAREKMKGIYSAIDPEGNEGEIRHIIWSDSIECPNCGKSMLFGRNAVSLDPVTFMDSIHCPKCDAVFDVEGAERTNERYRDNILGKSVTRRKRIPLYVYGITGKKKWVREATKDDSLRIAKFGGYSNIDNPIMRPISWGVLYRNGYHKGISHLHQFYTERNFYVLSTLFDLIKEFPESIQDFMKVWVLSYNLSHATLMTRVVAKKNSRDFVLTGSQPGVLYISGLPVEKNILIGLERKIKTFSDAFKLVEKSKSEVTFRNHSSTELLEGPNTIDYVFTDPPFGDYIPYSELNQINEAWLGEYTSPSNEVIINEAQNKSLVEYTELMKSVFNELQRVLRAHSCCTLVFHSAKSEIWQAIISSFRAAGFTVRKTSILNKKQASFKQTNSTITVKGDPLILLENARENLNSEFADGDDLAIAEHVIESFSSNPDGKEKCEMMFSRYITLCIERGIKIKLDAQYFFNVGKE